MPRYRLTYDQGGRVIPLWIPARNRDEARGYWRALRDRKPGQRVRLYDRKGRLLAGPQEHGLVSTAAQGSLWDGE